MLRKFVRKTTKSSPADPAFLILDNHRPHAKNLDVILKARERVMSQFYVCLHTAHIHFNYSLFPVSVYPNQISENCMNNNSGTTVTVFILATSDVFTELDFVSAENNQTRRRIHPPLPTVSETIENKKNVHITF